MFYKNSLGQVITFDGTVMVTCWVFDKRKFEVFKVVVVGIRNCEESERVSEVYIDKESANLKLLEYLVVTSVSIHKKVVRALRSDVKNREVVDQESLEGLDWDKYIYLPYDKRAIDKKSRKAYKR